VEVEMTAYDRKVDQAWTLLRIGFTAIPIAAGLDKFFGVLADWEMYLSPVVARLLPVAPETFMKVSGVVEIAVGVLMATRFTRLAAYVAAAWLAAIALNLVSTGMFYDIAVRDLAMALAALVLALLSEARAARRALANP
jgi:hypothetical protein